MGQVVNEGNSSLNGSSNMSDLLLEQINNQMAITLLPAMLVLVVLMIVGITGNSLVVYVFCFKMKFSTQNILIVYLAVFDLLSCTVSIPYEITDMRYFYTFPSETACKIMRFVNTFCAIGSIMTLIVIAVDRFRKICRPSKRQMYTRHVKLSLIPVLALALVFSLPAFVMYGIRATETTIPGLVGYDCSTPNAIENTLFPLLYNLLLFACFIIISVTLCVLYICILRESNRHNRFMKRNTEYSFPSSGHSNKDSSSYTDRTPVTSNVSPSDTALVAVNPSIFKYSSEPSAKTSRDENLNNNGEINFRSSANTSQKKSPRIKSKTTIIAFTVTLVFILSFLPHLSLQVAKMILKGFVYDLKGSSMDAYNIFLRSYFFNSVSNPFIYSALNVKFKNEVKGLLRRLSCRT
ncbi:hypothetical protein Btru_066342 [Bulinus truncatus]|nr:hypothetical protein Btru_066342 [Bulinus truncatus]